MAAAEEPEGDDSREESHTALENTLSIWFCIIYLSIYTLEDTADDVTKGLAVWLDI